MKNIGITLCIGISIGILLLFYMFLYYVVLNLFFGVSPLINMLLLVLFIIIIWYLVQAMKERILEIKKGEHDDLSKY